MIKIGIPPASVLDSDLVDIDITDEEAVEVCELSQDEENLILIIGNLRIKMTVAQNQRIRFFYENT